MDGVDSSGISADSGTRLGDDNAQKSPATQPPDTLPVSDAAGRAGAAASFAPSQTVFPNYQIIEPIGKGGMGVVYKAKQKSPSRIVALKTLPGSAHADRTARARFLREGAAIGLLNHPYIVPIYESGEAGDGTLYYTMELVEGEPVDQFVENRKPVLKELLALFIKVCDGVQAAHQRGVIHRDLKPSNILVDANGNPRVLDFGLAKIASEEVNESLQVSIDGQVVGTPAFMAPEQTLGKPEEVDTRTDVYALGVILYRLLTGKFPYCVGGDIHLVMENIRYSEPVLPRTHVRTLAPDLEAILLKALAKEKERRYQTVREFSEDMKHFLMNETVRAHMPSATYKIRKLIARHKAITAAMATAVLSLATIHNVGLYRIDKAREKAYADKLLALEARRGEIRQRRMANTESRKAEAALELGKLALQETARTMQDNPRLKDQLLPRITLQTAETFERREDWGQAEKYYREVIDAAGEKNSLKLNAARAVVALGRICLKTGRTQEAKNHFVSAVEKYSSVAEADEVVTEAKMELGKFPKVSSARTPQEHPKQVLSNGRVVLKSPVDSTVQQSSIMKKASSPYEIRGDVMLTDLLIEPGTSLLFRPQSTLTAVIQAIGTEQDPIVFQQEAGTEKFSFYIPQGDYITRGGSSLIKCDPGSKLVSCTLQSIEIYIQQRTDISRSTFVNSTVLVDDRLTLSTRDRLAELEAEEQSLAGGTIPSRESAIASLRLKAEKRRLAGAAAASDKSAEQSLRIEHSDFDNSRITIQGCNGPTVMHNRFTGRASGINVQTFSGREGEFFIIGNNLFESCKVAFQYTDAAALSVACPYPHVLYNIFRGNSVDIYVVGGPADEPMNIDVQYNNFEDGTGNAMDIRSKGDYDIQARNNWWGGTGDGPKISRAVDSPRVNTADPATTPWPDIGPDGSRTWNGPFPDFSQAKPVPAVKAKVQPMPRKEWRIVPVGKTPLAHVVPQRVKVVEGGIWFSDQNALSFYDVKTRGITVLLQSTGWNWITWSANSTVAVVGVQGGQGGVFLLNAPSKTASVFAEAHREPVGKKIAVRDDNYYFSQGYGGLWVFQAQNRSWEKYPLRNFLKKGQAPSLCDFVLDRNGDVWGLQNSGGKVSDGVVALYMRKGQKEWDIFDAPAEMGATYMNSMMGTTQGFVWFSTWDGKQSVFFRVNKSTLRWHKVPAIAQCRALSCSTDGVYALTGEKTICYLSDASEQWTPVSIDSPQPISGLAIGKDNLLYVGASDSISVYDAGRTNIDTLDLRVLPDAAFFVLKQVEVPATEAPPQK